MADSRAQGMAFKEMADQINRIALKAMADQITQLHHRVKIAEGFVFEEGDRVHAAAWAEGFEDGVSCALAKQDELMALAESEGLCERPIRSDSTEWRSFLRKVGKKEHILWSRIPDR